MDEQTKNITHTGYPATHPGRIVDCDLCMSSDEALPKPGSEPLSVVQRTQIREQLIRCIEQGSIIEKKLRGDPLYSKGPITPSLAQKQCEDFADECLSAIGQILGSEE